MRYPFNGNYRLTQGFGENPAAYAKFGMKGHNGLDYGLPTGTPVLAAEDGKVVTVASDPPGFGNYVRIQGNYVTLYAHLDHATVPVGTRVTAGQQIGVSDNTGNSSGPHLHFGIKPLTADNNNGYFGAIDPMPILKQGESAMTITDKPASYEFAAKASVEVMFRSVPMSTEEFTKFHKGKGEIQLTNEFAWSNEATTKRAALKAQAASIEPLKKSLRDFLGI